MNEDEAKKILALYRPGTEDHKDPVFKAAAELAKPNTPPGEGQGASNARLAGWFKDHCSSYASIRNKFLKIPMPPGLKEKILAGQPAPSASKIVSFPTQLLRIAAVLAVSLGLVFVLWRPHSRQNGFNAYRGRMEQTAMSSYGMPLHSHDLPTIQEFLAKRKAPAQYVLPEGISKAQPIGCAIVRWQNAPVSLICFHTGQTAAAADKPDLWLFITDQASVPDAPAASSPVIAPSTPLTTASWSRDGRVYILAVAGDEEFLKKYL